MDGELCLNGGIPVSRVDFTLYRGTEAVLILFVSLVWYLGSLATCTKENALDLLVLLLRISKPHKVSLTT